MKTHEPQPCRTCYPLERRVLQAQSVLAKGETER